LNPVFDRIPHKQGCSEVALSKAQQAMVEKARTIGAGGQGVALTEGACSYVVSLIAADLGVNHAFPEFDRDPLPFFGDAPISLLELAGVPFLPLLERLVSLVPDADLYFACLAKLHKSRLKYERVLQTQALPNMEQIQPRSLLEFGKLSPAAMGAYLLWRKWIFDVDNRAAQETGYLFEPIIASAIGGVSASAKRSPIRRQNNPNKGRQVDCIKGDRAYEFKLRVTIAASGQGRWAEELSFPQDCRKSGYMPMLIVLDSTPNPKLAELREAFEEQGGESFIGSHAWEHLNDLAGPTMGKFLKRYVHMPMRQVIENVMEPLPPLTIRMAANNIAVNIGDESFVICRSEDCSGSEANHLPDDVDEETPGP